MIVSWNWKDNLSGFQIQYAQNKKFTKKKKSKMVGMWTSQKTISKLKKARHIMCVSELIRNHQGKSYMESGVKLKR